ncbi:MAG: DNRLRE domain-containing protein [Gammaproteobacteria bacterium]|nr:DNRLRE domain-containing protein [Gammaproteobacteria bacterium]MDH3411079.1 DNRLRE domain-containing protein [Gammaproteobacteria bacterium]
MNLVHAIPHLCRHRLLRTFFRGVSPRNGIILLPVLLALLLIGAIAFLINDNSAMNVNDQHRNADSTEAQYVAKAGLNQMQWQANKSNCTGYSNLTNVPLGSNNYSVTITPTSGSPVSINATGTTGFGASNTIQRDRVKVYQTPTTANQIMGVNAADKDTTLTANKPTTNYGTSHIFVSAASSVPERNGLLYFDVSSIPPGVKIISAQLELFPYYISSPGGSVSVHRVKQDWVEGTRNGGGIADGATWNTADGSQNWDDGSGGNAYGGNYDATAVASRAIVPPSSQWKSWSIETLVSGWVNGVYPNQGLLLKGSGTLSAEFADKGATAGDRPKLTVSYACECGQTCAPPPPTSCNADYTPDSIVYEFSTAGYSQRLNRGITYFPPGQVLNGVTSPADGAWIAVGGSGILWMVGMDGSELNGSYATGLSQLEGIAFVPAANPADPGHLAIVKGKRLYYSDMTLPANGYSTNSLNFAANLKGITYIDGGTYDGHLALADMGNRKIHIIDQSFNLITTLATQSILNVPEGIAHLKDTDKFLIIDTADNRALIINTSLVISQQYDLTPFSLGAPTGAAAAIHPDSCNHVFGDRPNNRYAYLNAKGEVLPPTTVTLNATADAMVLEGLPTRNYGTSTTLGTYVLSGAERRTVVQFDVSGIPPGTPIVSAILRYNAISVASPSGSEKSIFAVKLTESWLEGTGNGTGSPDGVTWQYRDGSINWITAGGSFSVKIAQATEESSGISPPPATFDFGWLTWDLTPLVQEWVDGISANNGVLLLPVTVPNMDGIRFDSREASSNTPQLVITY